MMIAGSISAQKPSIKAQTISRSDLRGGLSTFSLRATHHQAKHSPTPSIRPGKIPARNSFEIETPPATPNSTKPMLGGITGAMMPPAATRPAAYILLWPAATIIGHQQRRQRRGVGGGRARQRGKHAGGEDGDVAEAALDMADQRQRDVDDAPGEPAAIHELAGQHEERHRHQRKAVGAVDDVLGDDLRSRKC